MPTRQNLAYSDMTFESNYQPRLSQSQDSKAIKVSALHYLARREYSRLELFRKLSQKYSSGENIQRVLDQLQEQGYQSDDRFTESFIRSKVNAGDGPFKIKIALRERGICESTVLSAFDRQSIDWLSIAEKVKNKRFSTNSTVQLGDELLDEDKADDKQSQLAQRAKQIRYLKNKGFYQEHIDQVIKNN